MRGQDLPGLLVGARARCVGPAASRSREGAGPMRVIAIDGPAGSGKSTVARALAAPARPRLPRHRRHVPGGHLRRPAPGDRPRRRRAGRRSWPRTSTCDVVDDGTVTVDGVDATIEIRGPEVTRAVSIVAANPGVRAELRRRQREWAEKHGGGVIEGRDIGTVVFPDAELKVYLTAVRGVRAARRHKEVADLDYERPAAIDRRARRPRPGPGRQPAARGRRRRGHRHDRPAASTRSSTGSSPSSTRAGADPG